MLIQSTCAIHLDGLEPVLSSQDRIHHAFGEAIAWSFGWQARRGSRGGMSWWNFDHHGPIGIMFIILIYHKSSQSLIRVNHHNHQLEFHL